MMNGAGNGAGRSAGDGRDGGATVARNWAAGRAELAGWLVLLGLVVVYGLFLSRQFAPAIAMPDDNGYFAQASRLVRDGTSVLVPESDAQYIGLHWLLTPTGVYVSRYPWGLSLLIAPLYAMFGWRAGVLVNPLLAVLALVGPYVLVRKVVGGRGVSAVAAGLAATALLATHPVFNHHALAGDAHMAVLCLLVWGVVLLLAWRETGGASGGWVWAGGAGLLLGMIPTVRYPDVVVGLGVGLLAAWTAAGWWREGRKVAAAAGVAAMVLAATAVVLPLLVRNQIVFGAFWRTGYWLSHEQTGFSLTNLASNWRVYLQAMQSEGAGLMWGLGVAGMAAMAAWGPTRAVGLMLAGIALPMLGLYMAYYWAGVGGAGGRGTLRFLLPTLPVYVTAGMWLVVRATGRLSPAACVGALAAVVAAGVLWGAAETQDGLARASQQRANLASVTAEMERVVPAGAVVVGEPGLLQHLDYVGLWKLADPSLYRGGPTVRGGPVLDTDAPSPMQAAKAAALREKYTGSMEQRRAKFLSDVHVWGRGAGVYAVGSEQELNALGGLGGVGGPGGQVGWEVVGRVTIRPPPSPATPRGANARPAGPPGPPGAAARGRADEAGRAVGPGGGGGLFAAGVFGGAREVVIARWTGR